MVANLATEISIVVEFEQLRGSGPIGRAARIAARKDKDVALGIDGDSRDFAQIQFGWQFQKIGYGTKGNLRNRRGLGESGTSENTNRQQKHKYAVHESLRREKSDCLL